MDDVKEPSTSTGVKTSKDDIKNRIRSKSFKIQEKIKERKQELKVKGPLHPIQCKESATRPRRNSKNNSISSSITNDCDSEQGEKPKRKRQRTRVKNSDNVDNKQQPIPSSIQLDAESELIIQLLSLRPAKREDFLLRKAEDKGLIDFNKTTKSFSLNERLLASGSNLQTEDNSSKKKPKPLELGRTLKFESWVNSVILEGIPAKDHKKFNFLFENRDKKLPQRELYIDQPEFVNRLEKHAQYCVKENLGEIIEGELRISNVNYYHAFVTRNVPNGKKDAMVCSKVARKFALHGDIVRCFVRNQAPTTEKTAEDNSDDSVEISSKAFVIEIIKKVHDRKCIGLFSPKLGEDFATFIPRDSKLPHIRIKNKDFPKEEKKTIGDTLYVAQIDYFTLDVCFGKILFPVGKCGELEAENKAILLSNHLKHEPYEEKFNEMYNSPLEITDEELSKREDIRNECVFTIDPLTAKDLDDAVSVKTLPDGNYEIGVHISDVSYFLEENSDLDNIVKERTTSVYLVQEVFHMLPKPLCFKCSLLPGEDKFAFSVFWKITTNAEIVSTRFSRTILNSCTQFAYEHAQKIIDNEDQTFDESDFPKIEGNWKVSDIVERVKILNTLAQIMRQKRFDNGAMSINRPKIYFDLHPETGEPVSYKRYETDSANFLIEEFMLLANQSVAKFIFEKYPNLAILRNHLPPQDNLILSCQKKLGANNIKLDTSSSKAIYASMRRILEELSLAGEDPDSMGVALSHVISKTLKRATYFCSDQIENEKQLWHFALSIPIYTHFTSPIRRYPDILVHRLLAAGLNYTSPPKSTPDELHLIAKTCNDMKYNAKIAGEHSSELYFLHYVKSKGSLVEKAVVVDAFQASCEAVLVTSGYKVQIPYARSHLKVFFGKEKNFNKSSGTYLASSENNKEKIDANVFSVIDVVVSVKKEKLYAEIKTSQTGKEQAGGEQKPDVGKSSFKIEKLFDEIKTSQTEREQARGEQKDDVAPVAKSTFKKVTTLVGGLEICLFERDVAPVAKSPFKTETLFADIETSQTGKEQATGEHKPDVNKSTLKTSKFTEDKKSEKKERRRKNRLLREIQKHPVERVEALTELFRQTLLE